MTLRFACRRAGCLHAAEANSAWAQAQRLLGRALLAAARYLMKALSIAGTAAMFLVGGGILTHSVPPLAQAIKSLVHSAGALGTAVSLFADAIVSIVAGAVVPGTVSTVNRSRKRG